TGNSYTTPALSSDTWYRITETCGQQTCTVKVTVVPDPSINSYSSNLTICSGATANLSVSATGGTPGLSYQWYTGATCGGTTTLIAGATNVSYTTPSLTQTTYYRAVVSATGNGCNTVFTGCIGVFVPVITQQPQGTVLCSGGTHTMTVAASSGGGTETYTYQWQLSPTNSPYAWSNVTGGTGGNSPSYTTPVLSTGDYYYRCVISIIGPVGCADLESSPAYVQAFNDPVVADQTTSRQICKGTSTSLSVTVTGGTGTLSYQWQSGTKSTPPEAMNCGEVDTWTNVTGGSGANTASYTTPVLNTAGIYFYRCFITQTGVGCGPVISACIPVTVDPIPNAVPTPSSQSICSGTASSTVVLTSAVPGTTFAWTRTTPAGITTSQPVSGSGDITGATFTNSTSAPVTVTYTITPTGPAPTFCVGSPVTATVTVSPIPSVTSASSKTVCNNTNIAYTPTSAVSGTTFAWSASVITGTVTGYSATGSGAITDVLNNTGTSLATVQYSITPTGPAPTYCVGSAFNFNAHVEPTPDVIATPSTRTFCSGGNTAITLTTNVPGTTFYYAAPVITPGGSGAVTGWSSRTSPGNTNGINDVLVNTTAAIQTVTYTVYPIINGCVGTSITVVITVNPVPVITSNQEVNVCANASGIASVNYAITTTPSMSGALFLWPLPGEDPPLTGGTGRPVASSANLQDTYNNGGATTILNAVYPVTPVAPASLGSCQGNMTIVTVHVIPFPVASATPSGPTICSGSQTGISLSSNLTLPLYADFTWTAALQSGTATGFSGGSGTSINQTLSNTSSSPAVVRYTVTPTVHGYSCSGNPLIVDVTVNPLGQVNQPGSQVVCNNTSTAAINFSTTNTGGTTTYSWTNNRTSIGLAASGTGDIGAFTATNSSTAQVTATIVVTPHFANNGVSCTGSTKTFTIRVNPTGQVNQPANQTVCRNATTTVSFTTNNTGGTTTYAWTNDNTSIGLGASGSGNISFTALNSTTAPIIANITVTPTYTNSGVSCSGASKSFTITVNPLGQVNKPADQVLCNNTFTTQVDFSTSNTGGSTTYSWTNNTPSIGLAATGSGSSIASFKAVNAGTAPVTATITVTPTFANGGTNCQGSSQSFTITVNPNPTVNSASTKTICSNSTVNYTITSATTGTTYTWTASVVTPPTAGSITGFSDCSSSCGSLINHTLLNSGTSPGVVRYVITPTGPSPTLCPGTVFNFDVTVNPSGQVNQPNDTAVCNGGLTTRNFSTVNTGGTTTYIWTNNNTAIGLGASGTGNISFTATNSGTSPVTGSITVTPTFTNNGVSCTGSSKTFTIIVNPTGQVNQPIAQIRCHGEGTSTVVFSTVNTVGTTTYAWTNSNTSIGLAATGTGTIWSFAAQNTGNSPVISTITVTPYFSYGGTTCSGSSKSFTITVNPTAQVNQPDNVVQCHNSPVNVTFTTTNTGGVTTYSWTNNNTSIGLGASGTGPLSFTAMNTGTAPTIATIEITPTFTYDYKSCTGPSKTMTITVNPTGQVDQPGNQVVCNQFSTTQIDFSTVNSGGSTTYTWTNDTPSIGLAGSGSGPSILPFTAINGGTSPVTATITVIPTFTNGGPGCQGPSKNFTITVNPTGQVNQPGNQVLCNGASTTPVTFGTGNSGGVTTYTWVNDTPSINLAASGTGNIGSFTATNATNAPVTATITVTPHFSNGGTTCDGPTRSFTITVNPTATGIATPSAQTFCSGLSANIILSSPVAGTTFWWPAPIITGPLGASSVTGASTRPTPGTSAALTDILTNVTAGIARVTYHITPRANNCDGTPFDVVITVNPKPALKTGLTQNLCQGETANLQLKTLPSMGSNVSYSWPAPVLTGGMTYVDNGQGNYITDDYYNPTSDPQTATYSVTPTAAPSLGGCVGDPGTVVITVNPTPVLTAGLAETICSGTHANRSLTTTPPTTGTVFSYPAPDVTGGITGGVSRVIKSSAPITDLLVNPTNTTQTATYHVTPWINNCAGAMVDVVITVLAAPTTANAGADQVMCGHTTPGSVTMAANTPLAGTGAWSLVTATSGALTPGITNATSPTTSITNLGFGTATGSVTYTFRWTISNGLCSPSADEVNITLNHCCPVTYNETGVNVCKNSTNFPVDVLANGDYSPEARPLHVNTTPVSGPAHGSLTYLSGSTFLYTPTPGYTGSDRAIVGVCDNVTPTPCCVNDTIFFTVVQAVTADPGPNQLLCNQYMTYLTGNWPPAGSTGNWKFVSGPSVVTPSPVNSPMATVVGLIGSSTPYVFRYVISTTTGGVTCRDSAQMTVTNYHYPTYPFAGNDQKLCLTAATVSTTMAANLPLYGTGAWQQVSKPAGGTNAVIANSSSPTTTISNLSQGTYTFSWGIYNGVCDTLKDLVDVSIYAPCDVEAGGNGQICEGSTYTLNGSSALNCGNMIWGTTGSGYFNDPTLLHPVYTPGASDILNGSVVLYLKCSSCCGIPCPGDSSALTLTILPAAKANAGTDGQVCRNSTYTVSGATAAHSSSVFWTHNGAGILTNATTLTPTYDPADHETGPITLTLTANSMAPCTTPATDQMVLTVVPEVTATAGPDNTICQGNSFLLSAAAANNYTSLTWSGGSGTFSDIHALNPIYTPATTETGAVHLTLTATGNLPCSQTQDEMVLTIRTAPSANAGPDAQICESA
ncbi:MAG TPA: Ig-like domain-containing protein, partial [Bacteroidales bacterium]|nr:Ig-like domain-containing protein [Bacteroidales bacterium]